MDSITHTLNRAILAQGAPVLLASVPTVHMGYAGASGSDLYISLKPGPDVQTLWMEFSAAGLTPPCGMLTEGCEVILSPGHISVFAMEDATEPKTWCGELCQQLRDRKAGWSQQYG